MVKAGQVVELAAEVNEKAEWYYDVAVRLPADMSSGNWQMIVRAVDGTEHVVPIPISVSRK